MSKHLDIYPGLSDVLYARPNPDGTRKLCNNCTLYLGPTSRCLIHDPDLFIGQHQVCGYHVYGPPLEKKPVGWHAEPQDPKFTGLITTWGTSCDRCAWYRAPPKDKPASSPTCLGVYENGHPAPVEPKGCCARWVKA